MAQLVLILAFGTFLTNVTQDFPLTWLPYQDLCRAAGCQVPEKPKCGTQFYDHQTHLCCGDGTDWSVTKKPTPRYDCCGFRVYEQNTEQCCEDLSIKSRRDSCPEALQEAKGGGSQREGRPTAVRGSPALHANGKTR